MNLEGEGIKSKEDLEGEGVKSKEDFIHGKKRKGLQVPHDAVTLLGVT
jgi:hypothetical protein